MSTIRATPSHLPAQTQSANAAATAGMTASGSWKGREIVLKQKPPGEAQANAVEELCRDAAIRLRERDKKEEVKELPDLQIVAHESADGYLDMTGQHDQAEELMRRMRRTPEQAATLARQQRDDPALGYLALQRAYAAALEDGERADIISLFEDALTECETQQGPALRAALNTIAAAVEQQPTSAQLKSFQATYRDIVLGTPTVGETLTAVLREFGEARFGEGLQQMIRALGQDLNAARPSASPVRLNQLVQDLYHLQVVGTVLEDCGNLCMELTGRAQPLALSSQQLMERIINLAGERWITGQRVLSLTETCDVRILATQIYFVSWVRRMLKRLPLKIFYDEDCRGSVLNASQEALDTLIAREEEGEDEDDGNSDGEGSNPEGDGVTHGDSRNERLNGRGTPADTDAAKAANGSAASFALPKLPAGPKGR
ncbi:type III secretion system gatekeeper subunit SctW [Imbroritus primus]|uniref:type III secretion system gatekeeper subunit SctW n=1 Tax=Imbroritus primus TaxID=3058603 RepID=UPI003D16197E